jgi:hypothetical protein
LEKVSCRVPILGSIDIGIQESFSVIADVTDPDTIQTILAHLKQRVPPDAVCQQRPEQGPQNDLFAAI